MMSLLPFETRIIRGQDSYIIGNITDTKMIQYRNIEDLSF